MLNLAKKFNETSLNEFELKFKVELWKLKLMKGWQKKTINSIKIIKTSHVSCHTINPKVLGAAGYRQGQYCQCTGLV